MEQVQLGRTGRMISRVGLGAMPLSLQGRPEDRDAAKRVIQRAVELDVTLIDTADVYCLGEDDIGHNERLIREALGEVDAAGRVLVATKGGMTRPEGRWERNGRPEHLRRACEQSLGALGVDSIDLYQLHQPDPEVPFEESVGALARLREEGKVQAVGLSNVTLEQLRQGQEIVEITSVQNRYNPWDRSAEESGLIRYCAEQGITFLPYSPVGGRRRVELLRHSTQLQEIGDRFRASPEQVVLAWILAQSDSLVPIPGASRPESIESSVRVSGIRVDDAMKRELGDAFRTLPE